MRPVADKSPRPDSIPAGGANGVAPAYRMHGPAAAPPSPRRWPCSVPGRPEGASVWLRLQCGPSWLRVRGRAWSRIATSLVAAAGPRPRRLRPRRANATPRERAREFESPRFKRARSRHAPRSSPPSRTILKARSGVAAGGEKASKAWPGRARRHGAEGEADGRRRPRLINLECRPSDAPRTPLRPAPGHSYARTPGKGPRLEGGRDTRRGTVGLAFPTVCNCLQLFATLNSSRSAPRLPCPAPPWARSARRLLDGRVWTRRTGAIKVRPSGSLSSRWTGRPWHGQAKSEGTVCVPLTLPLAVSS